MVLVCLAGCKSPPQLPAVNLGEPGWRVQNGQALWRAAADRTEIAGELMVGQHADGRWVLEFSKPPFSLVSARGDARHWQIAYPLYHRSYSGEGTAPPALGWLHLREALAGLRLPLGWRFDRDASGHWVLESVRTGERIKGYLQP